MVHRPHIGSRNETSSHEAVVLISGGTGVGTSTLAGEIAPVIRARGIIGTDTLRGALRHLGERKPARYSGPERAILARSTYETWRVKQGENASQTDPTEADILKGYYLQADLVFEAVVGAARRAIDEGFTIIIEGVHLPLSYARDLKRWVTKDKEWPRVRSHIFTVLVDCDDATQIQHLKGRDPRFANRDPKKYLANLHAIQTIRRELQRIGEKTAHAVFDSKVSPSREVDFLAQRFYEWKLTKGNDPRSVRFSDS